MTNVRVNILLLLCFCTVNGYNTGCLIDLNEDPADHLPLIMNPTTAPNFNTFWKPDKYGIIRLKSQERLAMSCPGSQVSVNGIVTKYETGNFTCLTRRNFSIDDLQADFKEIRCNKPIHDAVRITGKRCLEQFEQIEIGFQYTNGIFVRLIEVCFDATLQNTIYSTHRLSSSILGHQKSPRVDFVAGQFYNTGKTSVKHLYTRKTQRKTLNALLGLDPDSYKYVGKVNDYFLARGHLAAKADFMYGTQQKLTFKYVNVAPQWQTFNAGNWLKLEDSVRYYASNRSAELIIYTGTYGIATLPHAETGEETELYLFIEADSRKAVPVPKLYWKVVYEPVTKKAIAFVGENNPYRESYQPLCDNICDQIKWVSWKGEDRKLGYVYCCSVDSFRKVFKSLPLFKTEGILM